MGLLLSKSLLFHLSRNRAVLSLLPILTVVFLATGFPIAALSYEEQCANLFSDTSEDIFARRQGLILKYTKGAKSFTEVRTFGLKSAALPYSQQQTVLLDIGAVYRLVPKKDPSPLAAWHIGGRRLLDYAQTLISRWDLFFKSEVGRGASTAQTYGKFLKHQQEIFASNYGLTEVMLIIQTLQKNLQTLQPAGHQGPGYKLLLAGSFINGKANLQKSDIDMTVSAPVLVSELPSWEKQLNEALRNSLGGAAVNMTLEAHVEPAAFYGKINPIVIEITRDAVQILVFEPAIIHQRPSELQAGKTSTYPLFAPAPQSLRAE